MTDYFVVKYDNEAGGPFVEEGVNITWTGGVGFLVTLIDRGLTGKLYCALVSGVLPSDNLVLTQGGVTADADGAGVLIAYPAYFRKDTSLIAKVLAWTGPALGVTHSFFFDGQTGNVVTGEILTFSPGGQLAEVITIESDIGVSGELSVRFISNLDEGLPADNDTFVGDIAGDGTLNGTVHDRAYQPLHEHRLLADLNDDEDISGDDDLSRIDATPSDRSTDQIIALIGGVTMTDEVALHMYGGSVSQNSGDDLFSGLDVQVTSPNTDTQPVVFQNDAIISDYWKNAYMPDSIAGNVRIMVKTREDGVDIDGKRVRGALLENKFSFFFGGTTIGTASTALALFASPDGNNTVDVATLAVSPYSDLEEVEGLQLVDYNNGNGTTEFGYKINYGADVLNTPTALQAYERTKYIQRRGSAEILFGRNAQLFIGFNTNFAYNNESANLTQSEVMYWGTEIVFSGQTVNMTIGEVVTFAPSGAKGRLLYVNDAGVAGTMVFAMEPGIDPTAADTMTGVDSGGDGAVDSVVLNSTAGSFLAMAIDDDGVTGNLYGQLLTGILPANTQTLFGGTSNSTVDVNGAVATRTINNQYMGVFTGANFQTNFGIATDPSDAIVGDKLKNFANVDQAPPDNQTGQVTGLKEGDTATVYPWDGVSVDSNGDALPTFGEMLLATALTGASTQIDVGAGNIPDNTPAAGFLRVERDSDNNLDLIEYSAHDGDAIYTLVGTAPSIAAIGNTVMRALIDIEMAADGSASYTAVKGAGNTQVAITVKNGYTAVKNGPIKVFKTDATFSATGFSVGAVRTSDA